MTTAWLSLPTARICRHQQGGISEALQGLQQGVQLLQQSTLPGYSLPTARICRHQQGGVEKPCRDCSCCNNHHCLATACPPP